MASAMFLARGVDHGRVDVEAPRAKLGNSHPRGAEASILELAKSLTPDLLMSIHPCYDDDEKSRNSTSSLGKVASAFSGFNLAGQETSETANSTLLHTCRLICQANFILRMASQSKSRWANDEEDQALSAQRKQEKEAKKRAKAARQRKLEATETATPLRQSPLNDASARDIPVNGSTEPPSKRRRLSPPPPPPDAPRKLLRFFASSWGPCRHVDNFEKLNHIEEGSYGWVSRARENATGEVVALKKLKMEPANDGFPVTGLREIQTLIACRHEGIVGLREVVMGDATGE